MEPPASPVRGRPATRKARSPRIPTLLPTLSWSTSGSPESAARCAPLLRRHWPHAELLMLTVHDEGERIFGALCAGATGYLLKATPPTALLDAIREAHDGGAQ